MLRLTSMSVRISSRSINLTRINTQISLKINKRSPARIIYGDLRHSLHLRICTNQRRIINHVGKNMVILNRTTSQLTLRLTTVTTTAGTPSKITRITRWLYIHFTALFNNDGTTII